RRFGVAHRFHCSRRVSYRLSQQGSLARCASRDPRCMIRISLLLCFALPALAASTNEMPLTLSEARDLALKTHPRITAADLRALAAKEVVIETRASYFPTIVGNATAVGTTDDNTRIAAGSLSNPSIFERNAEGVRIT